MSQLGIGRPTPAYVERGGDVVYRTPFRARGARMYAFFIPADPGHLQAVIDRTLIHPSQGAERYRTFANHVVLSFMHVERLTGGQGDERLGAIPESEGSIWMPMVDMRRNRLVWMVPYMYVDGSAAVAGGREIFGLPKQLGQIRIPPAGDTAPDSLSVQALVIKKFRPRATGRMRPVFRVDRLGPDAAPLPPARLVAAEGGFLNARNLLMTHRGRGLPDIGGPERDDDRFDDERAGRRRSQLLTSKRIDLLQLLAMFFADFADNEVTMVQLKQFRDIENPSIACFQSIVEVRNFLDRCPAWGVLPCDEYLVDIRTLDGAPIVRELGVNSVRHRPSFAMWLDLDFDLEAGQTLWFAPSY
ncbi:MAG: acetoacetate decarboxylase family protein [Acidimicrobiia bacterium]